MGQLGARCCAGVPLTQLGAKSGLVSQIQASGEVCEEAAANWGEIMRGDLTACRGKGQISRNRRGKCQGLSGVLGMEERWVTSGICQDWGRKARLGFVDVKVLGGGCRQLVAGLELEGRLQLGRHLQPSRGPVDGGCRRGRKGEESGCEA